jgi:two-component system sensor histidine kinase PilS (NtrC family)
VSDPLSTALADLNRGSFGPESEPYPNWLVLRWLFGFRLLIATGLIVAFASTGSLAGTSGYRGDLISLVLAGYLVTLFLSAFGLIRQRPKPERHLQLTIIIDIVAFTLLMHGAGGVTSGLGLLLAITVAAGALLMEGRLALLFASLASLAVIAEESLSQLYYGTVGPSYTQAGLLGVTFFTVALLSQMLYRRVRAAEWLAARRKVDLADLAKLNEFIIQSMTTGVLIVDGDRQLQMLNIAAKQLLGRKDAQPGTKLTRLSPPLADWLDISVSASVKSHQRQATLFAGNRELRPSLQWLGDYRASGVVIFLEDQQELTKAAQQIKLASLGTLTASIAHNIRNPLSSISHAAQLLAESPALAQEDRHLLDIVRRNGERIEEIIQSILQLSRRHQAEPEEIELADWLGALCADFRTSRGIGQDAVRLHAPESNLKVQVDPRHLSQILINLCENAIKHGSRSDRAPAVEVHVQNTPTMRTIEVLDDGPGIPPDKVQEVFDPFYTTSTSGTGLGLYIARELAEANGIRLEHLPREPHGCCFRLTFPI